ncbi:MAG TPA: SRPBCC family protein [Chthonomonadales bacterium]|nr:SRPBCC family protein [Chthonomonadales bacterium]
MHRCTQIRIEGDPESACARAYRLAADIQDWPKLLPHYRYLRVLEQGPRHKLADFGASRSGLPVSWRGLQELDPETGRIRYTHVKGITRGMTVEWRLEKQSDHVMVSLEHTIRTASRNRAVAVASLPIELFRTLIVGRLFVDHIAGKTLRCIKAAVENDPEKP